MNLKSSATRYGTFPIIIHWLSVFLIFGLLFSGSRAASMTDPVAKAQLLSLHAPIGSFIGLLTLIRIVWWIFIDRKPEPVSGSKFSYVWFWVRVMIGIFGPCLRCPALVQLSLVGLMHPFQTLQNIRPESAIR